ncbi:MAG: hypothetical protein AAFR21_14060, partial [Pseudomonadota bacterium]
SEPYLADMLAQISERLSIKLTLNDHWYHIFVLLQIYFARGVSLTFSTGRPVTGIFRLTFGILIATVASMLAGAIPIARGALIANGAIAFIPIVATFVNDVVLRAWFSIFKLDSDITVDRSRGIYFTTGVYRSFQRTLMAGAMLIAIAFFGAAANTAIPGVIWLLVLIAALGIYWSIFGLIITFRDSSDGPFWQRYLATAEAQLGLSIIQVFLWVSFFLVCNAGLGRIGL